MAKIDVSTIENYESMTPEEKVAALEAYTMPDAAPDTTEVTRLKNALNKASTDVAAYKKQLQQRMTDEEQKEAARKEAQENMERELADLKKEKLISGYKLQYMGMGYAEELADATAKAMADGDMATVFQNQKQFLEESKKAFREAEVDSQPAPSTGKPLSSKQIEDQITERLMKAAGI